MSRLQQIAKSREELAGQRRELLEKVTRLRGDAVAALPEMLARTRETLAGKTAKVYLAQDSAEAVRILENLLDQKPIATDTPANAAAAFAGVEVARASSVVLDEIGFDAAMAGLGVKVNLTRLEEIVVREMALPPSGHPHFPIIDQPRSAIEEALQRFTSAGEAVPPLELKFLACQKIRDSVIGSEFGVTGADCIVAEHGSMVLAEDEGNLRAVSNLPYKHVVVAGIEQLVGSAEDALSLVETASIFATGRIAPTYISFIGGPSRTGDIEFRIAYGMHGPKEVHVILLDNGRLAMRERGAGALLKCIDCGSCYESCCELAQRQGWKNVTLTAKGLALGLVQGRISRTEANLKMSEFLCPVGLSGEEVARGLGKV